MAVESQIYAALAADSEIQRLLGGRIYPVRIPQGAQLPALVYHRVSGVPYNHMGGGYGLSRVRIRLDIWALGYAEAKEAVEVAKAVVVATPIFEKMIEDCGPDWGDNKTFRTSIDIICWEKGGYCYE